MAALTTTTKAPEKVILFETGQSSWVFSSLASLGGLKVHKSVKFASDCGTGVPPVGREDLTWSWPRRSCHEDPSGRPMTGLAA